MVIRQMSLCLLLSISAVSADADEFFRTWKIKGKPIKARLVHNDGKRVKLRKPDRTDLETTLSKLSKSDRAYLKPQPLKKLSGEWYLNMVVNKIKHPMTFEALGKDRYQLSGKNGPTLFNGIYRLKSGTLLLEEAVNANHSIGKWRQVGRSRFILMENRNPIYLGAALVKVGAANENDENAQAPESVNAADKKAHKAPQSNASQKTAKKEAPIPENAGALRLRLTKATALGRSIRVTRVKSPKCGPLQYSQDKSRIAASDRKGGVFIWDSKNGTVRHQVKLPNAKGGVVEYLFSPDGKMLAARSFASQFIDVVDVESGTIAKSFDHFSTPRHMAFSGNGKTLATSASLLLWDVASGTLKEPKLANVPRGIAFAPNAAAYLGFVDGTYTVWGWSLNKAKSPKKLFAAPKSNELGRVAFSPTSKFVLATYDEGTKLKVYVWQRKSGKMVFQTATGANDSVLFASSKHLITMGKGQSFRLIDLETGKTVDEYASKGRHGPLRPHSNPTLGRISFLYGQDVHVWTVKP